MAVVLPFLAFIALLLYYASDKIHWRRAFLLAAVSWGALVTAATELLSLCHGINRLSISIFWGAISLSALIAVYRHRPELVLFRLWATDKNTLPPKRAKKSRKASDTVISDIGGGKIGALDSSTVFLLIPIGIVLATTFLIAVVSPPNNWDSMTYHMSRVVHWIQNHSVAHYPTNIIRQLYFAPWAEFAIMHMQILSGGDYFANLVQWFAMCGNIIGVTLIAGQFGADRLRQIFAAVITATIPMGILQSSSTQNDLIASFWLVCFVYFGIQLINTRETRHSIPAGAALGLAILTKGTAYFYAFPFAVWFLFTTIRNIPRHLLKVTIMVTLTALALNSGHYLRNIAIWGSPLAGDLDNVQTTRRDIPALLSNISRNIVNNTWTPVPALNMLQYQSTVNFHGLLGIDVSEPATSLHDAKFVPSYLSLHEDIAGNGLHTIMIIAALPVILFRFRNLSDNPILRYVLALMGGLVLFCLMLKWQPWSTRLQLPGFVLSAPLIAVGMPAVMRRWVVGSVTVLLMMAAIPWLFYNQSRPLAGDWTILGVDRNALYFASNPGLLPYFDQVTDIAANTSGCNNIAVFGNIDAYEYPLWVLIRSKRSNMPRIEHIKIENISNTIPLQDFKPCMEIELFQTIGQ